MILRLANSSGPRYSGLSRVNPGAAAMFSLFKKKAKAVLAVDIGHQNVKIALLSIKGRQAEATKTFMRPTPEGCLREGEIINGEKLAEFLSKACRPLLELSPKAEIVAGISGAKGLIIKKIDVLKIAPEQLHEHLPFEAERYLPYDINDIDLDYALLKKTKPAAEGAIPVLIAAIHLDMIKSYISLFEKAFLSCQTIDANSLALANIFEWSYGLNEELTFLLIDIGAEHTNIAVLHKGEAIFARSVPAGGKVWTEKMKEALHVSSAEAEDLKTSGGGPPKEAAEAISEANAHFCHELSSCLESFKSFFPDLHIAGAFLAGGGSLISGLDSAVAKKLSFSVEKMDILSKIEGFPKEEAPAQGPAFAVALGLALREAK